MPPDIGLRHNVGIIHSYEQSGMSQAPQCRVKPGQTGKYLRACSSRSDKVYCYRMLRVYEIVVDVVYSFHFSMSLSFMLFSCFSSSRLKSLSRAAFVTSTRFDFVGFPFPPRWVNSVNQNFLSQYCSSFS